MKGNRQRIQPKNIFQAVIDSPLSDQEKEVLTFYINQLSAPMRLVYIGFCYLKQQTQRRMARCFMQI